MFFGPDVLAFDLQETCSALASRGTTGRFQSGNHGGQQGQRGLRARTGAGQPGAAPRQSAQFADAAAAAQASTRSARLSVQGSGRADLSR